MVTLTTTHGSFEAETVKEAERAARKAARAAQATEAAAAPDRAAAHERARGHGFWFLCNAVREGKILGRAAHSEVMTADGAVTAGVVTREAGRWVIVPGWVSGSARVELSADLVGLVMRPEGIVGYVVRNPFSGAPELYAVGVSGPQWAAVHVPLPAGVDPLS